MQKYGGTVVHRTRDAHGAIEVVEGGGSRTLHFGTEPKQSSMSLDDPIRLDLGYTRAMTCALLFSQPPPRRVLLLGLGGGSLCRFLLHHFPDCRIDVVEYRERVVEVAHDWFHLPESERLHILIEDAGQFMVLADPDRYGEYDLILVDAYDHAGMSPSVAGISFFDACRARLGPRGALAANLWSDDRIELQQSLADLSRAFSGHLLRLPVDGKANLIALAVDHGSPKRLLPRLQGPARELESRLGVEFSRFLNALRRHNRLLF